MLYYTIKWVLKLSIPSSIIPSSNCENLKYIELQTKKGGISNADGRSEEGGEGTEVW